MVRLVIQIVQRHLCASLAAAATHTSHLPQLVNIPVKVVFSFCCFFFLAPVCSMVAFLLWGVSFHLCQYAFPALSDKDV